MSYIENPKTKGSGIICCIPQKGECPNKCPDCFFQGGRSYLNPIEENTPNMPPHSMTECRVVRVNDGHDSYYTREWDDNLPGILDYDATSPLNFYRMKFYNTAIPKHIADYHSPVVLTINPGKMTDTDFHKLDPIPVNLMFVRIRVNMWNLGMVKEAVEYYAIREVPVVLTFMAYFSESVPEKWKKHYIYRKRTLNDYWAIKTDSWRKIMRYWQDSPYEKWVYSCGKIEGESGTTLCRFCGNCLREYFATAERIKEYVSELLKGDK